MLAHAVGLSCKLLEKSVRVEAYFSDDTPAMDALIVVKNELGEIVVQGRTDDKGVWNFDRPAAGRYEVSVDAGAGHRAKEMLTVPELAAGSGTSAAVTGDGPCAKSSREFRGSAWPPVWRSYSYWPAAGNCVDHESLEKKQSTTKHTKHTKKTKTQRVDFCTMKSCRVTLVSVLFSCFSCVSWSSFLSGLRTGRCRASRS